MRQNIQPETMVRSNQSTAINKRYSSVLGRCKVVTSVEPNEGVRINEGLLKQLTGDDTVTARKLYGDEFGSSPSLLDGDKKS